MYNKKCLHYVVETTKCDMNSCTYNRRDPDGYCICKGFDFVGSDKKQKKHHNYLCSMERSI